MSDNDDGLTYPREAIQHYSNGAAVAMRQRILAFLRATADVSAAMGRALATSPTIPKDLRNGLAAEREEDAMRLRTLSGIIEGFDPAAETSLEQETATWAKKCSPMYYGAEGEEAALLALARRLTPLAYVVNHEMEDEDDPLSRPVRQILTQNGEPLRHPVSGVLLRASGATGTLAHAALRELLTAPAAPVALDPQQEQRAMRDRIVAYLGRLATVDGMERDLVKAALHQRAELNEKEGRVDVSLALRGEKDLETLATHRRELALCAAVVSRFEPGDVSPDEQVLAGLAPYEPKLHPVERGRRQEWFLLARRVLNAAITRGALVLALETTPPESAGKMQVRALGYCNETLDVPGIGPLVGEGATNTECLEDLLQKLLAAPCPKP